MIDAVAMQESRFAKGLVCPYCGAGDVTRWGRDKNQLQRYRCKPCNKTFNDRAGTPMYRTRLPEKWEAFAECMRRQFTCREVANELGIDHRTAFYWRHKVLSGLRNDAQPDLEGIVEADETFFPRSEKGSTPDGREPRKRGRDGIPMGLKDGYFVAVLVARDRLGSTRSLILDRVNKQQLIERFAPLLEEADVLCSDASTPMKGFAKGLGIKHYAFSEARKERKRGIYHIQNVNAYHSRLKKWMLVFNGVATKYLENYLAWHLFCEQAGKMRPDAANEVLLVNASSLHRKRTRTSKCPHCGHPIEEAAWGTNTEMKHSLDSGRR